MCNLFARSVDSVSSNVSGGKGDAHDCGTDMLEIATTEMTVRGKSTTVMGPVISAREVANLDEENKGGEIVMWMVE